MINAISILAGAAAGVYALIAMLTAVLNSKGLGDAEFGVVVVLTTMAMLTLVAALFARIMSLALLTLLTRGTIALEWARPSECVSFDSWMACSWNFAGRNGRQQGLRFLGLGIALQGDHDKSIINALAPAAQ
jgi:hypothetical protein